MKEGTMAITLGAYSFGESVCSVQESVKEAGGRDGRRLVLKGVLEGLPSLAAIEAQLDAIAAAASESAEVELRLRPGRVLMVKRTGFVRQVFRDALTASFERELEAPLAMEQAEEESIHEAVLEHAGPPMEIVAGGNTIALPVISLTPDLELVRPSVSMAGRTLLYDGVVIPGEVLIIDAVAGVVTVDGEDVTPYTEGDMPVLEPGMNELFFADESYPHPEVDAVLRFRARWW
jgi:hypothetical protein